MSNLLEVQVPDIGGGTDVEVIEILVQVGDIVEAGQSLIMLETDKATMEVPSPEAGTITRLTVVQGSKVNEGDSILELDVVSDDATNKDNGEQKEVTTEPDTPSVPQDGAPNVQADNTKDNNTDTTMPGSSLASEKIATSSSPSGVCAVDKNNIAYASPSVRKLAHQLDIALEKVPGTGLKNRITKEDVHAYVKSLMKKEQTGTLNTSVGEGPFKDLLAWPQVDFSKFGPVRRQPLSRIRKISGANLHRNWVTIPHVTNHEDADITELEAFRVQLNKANEKSGIKVTMVALLIKVLAAALKKYPEFNASLDGDEIVMKDYYHIGFAADTPNGLVVPVVRNADEKGILEVASEVSELAKKAREGKLTAADMSGGCISISSLGGIGGTYFTPIINAPEIAILGIGRAKTELKWNGKEAQPRLILPMSLSWDHRCVDGAQAGRFNAYIASLLNDIRGVLL